MPTDPITGARYPSSGSAPNGPQQIQDAVTDLSPLSNPYFSSTGARDSAYNTWTSAGHSMRDGLECYVQDVGKFRYMSGAWVQIDPPQTLNVTYVTPAGGSTTYSDYFGPSGNWKPLRIHRSGTRCLASGQFTYTGGTYSAPAGTPYTFANLPAGLAPTRDKESVSSYYSQSSGGQTGFGNSGVRSDGSLYIVPVTLALGPGFTWQVNLEWYTS